MPEAPPQSPPAPPPAAPAAEATAAPKMQPRAYALKFEPDQDFNETTLFVKGTVRGTVWISAAIQLGLRSLLAEESDKINDEVKIKDGMTISTYQAEITYWNLAYAIESIGGKPFEGSVQDKIKQLRGKATAVLVRMSMAYLEFCNHVDDLFRGKEALDLAKKS